MPGRALEGGLLHSAARNVTDPVLLPLGDSAMTIVAGEGINAAATESVDRLMRMLASLRIAGVTDIVPSYASVVIHYDPLTITWDDLKDRVLLGADSAEGSAGEASSSRSHAIPVQYDGEDLEEIARLTSMSVAEVIEVHSGREYRVNVIGFVPGFAYLGPLDDRLVIPRREVPRKRVPAGSVAIAEAQTGIYPSSTPGGWHLLGTTTIQTFDTAHSPPALFSVGDTVRFEAR